MATVLLASPTLPYEPLDAILRDMKVEEIAEAVAGLPPDQLARFRRWFTEFEAGRTDHAEEFGSAATKLGRIAGRAFADLKRRAKEQPPRRFLRPACRPAGKWRRPIAGPYLPKNIGVALDGSPADAIDAKVKDLAAKRLARLANGAAKPAAPVPVKSKPAERLETAEQLRAQVWGSLMRRRA